MNIELTEAGMENGENTEMDNMLCDLIDIHADKGNEQALRRVLDAIYKLLNGKQTLQLSTKLLDKLISIIVADEANEYIDAKYIDKVLDAVQLHARQFPWPGLLLLRKLSAVSISSMEQPKLQLHPHAAQILQRLLEDFVRELEPEDAYCLQLLQVIQQLLQSELQCDRSTACAIFKKLLALQSPQMQPLLQCGAKHWTAYIALLEQLEQAAPQLVLPMLSAHLNSFMRAKQCAAWLNWLRILLARLLATTHARVLHWTLEFLLLHCSLADLYELQLLPEFLAAINQTTLYDVENYLLPELLVQTFIQSSHNAQLLEALVLMSWQSLPLLHWLRCLQRKQVFVHTSVLLQLAACIRGMPHENLRYEAHQRIFELYDLTINNLSLADYLAFIKALCNKQDNFFKDYKRLAHKIDTCSNIAEQLNVHDYDLFALIYAKDIDVVLTLYKQLSGLAKWQHGCWRLYTFFYVLQQQQDARCIDILDYFQLEYGLHIELLIYYANLQDLQAFIIEKLHCNTEQEKLFVMHKSVDWFISVKFKHWSQLAEYELQPLELIEQGSMLTAIHLATLLKDAQQQLQNERILQSLLTIYKQAPEQIAIAVGIVKYASVYLADFESEQILAEVLEASQSLYPALVNCVQQVPITLLIRGLLSGNALHAEKRIEYAYLVEQYNYYYTSCRRRDSYIKFLTEDKSQAFEVLDELLCLNNEQFDMQAAYAENSQEHRIKLRLWRALLAITSKCTAYWSAGLCLAVLSLNELENIKYMQECLLARCLPSMECLIKYLKQLPELEPSQRISLISVAYIYAITSVTELTLDSAQLLLHLLLPQSMQQHEQLRNFTQIILYKLLLHFQDNNLKLTDAACLLQTLELNLPQLQLEYRHEARLLLPRICLHCAEGLQLADYILYMTNAPCDEYLLDSLRRSLKLKARLTKFRSELRDKSFLQQRASSASSLRLKVKEK